MQTVCYSSSRKHSTVTGRRDYHLYMRKWSKYKIANKKKDMQCLILNALRSILGKQDFAYLVILLAQTDHLDVGVTSCLSHQYGSFVKWLRPLSAKQVPLVRIRQEPYVPNGILNVFQYGGNGIHALTVLRVLF